MRCASLLLLAACAARPAANAAKLDGSDAAPPASAACLSARDARARAAELDRGGHAALALAKLDEANAACPGERAATAALELGLLATLGQCPRARELATAADAGAAAAGAKSACDAREAAPKGTEASARAKTREAWGAELAKDFARAKGLYLDAWAELHPNPRALEDAARMAARAGDAAESRRLRDRALAEAEASEHAVATLTERVRVTGGAPRLVGTTLLLANDGKVVARDAAAGELRVLVDGPGAPASSTAVTTLSPRGTLALHGVGRYSGGTLSVYDVLTGALLFKAPRAATYAASPDDSLVVVLDEETPGGSGAHARIYDVATGEVRTKLSGDWRGNFMSIAFSPDSAHVLVLDADGFRQVDAATGAYTPVRIASTFGVGGLSADGRFLAYLETSGDGTPLHVRDMTTGKDLARWTGNFHSVEVIGVSPDAKTIATASYSSLRLWDVATEKQLFKHERARYAAMNDPAAFSFSDDGKTVVLAGVGLATAWDVATGAEKALVTEQPAKKVRRVAPAPDGVAIVLEDEVRIVPLSGEPRTLCRGMKPQYFDVIGPTNVAFSASGKSFACVMSDGWVHVFDTAAWTERAVVKKGAAAPAERPVDLFFAGDAALTVVSDKGFVTYDAATAAEEKRVLFKHPSLGLAPRHARMDDGSVAVRLWNGSAAVFDADGKWTRDVKLVAAPMDALDAFSAGGATYAVALGKKLHVVDVASGSERVVELAAGPKSLAVSADGKSVAVAFADGAVSTVTDAGATPLGDAKGTRVAFAGKSTLVWDGKDTVDVYAPGAAAPAALEIDPDGVVARDRAGAFEARGKPEIACLVGKTWLSRETCADRAKDGLVEAWVRAAR